MFYFPNYETDFFKTVTWGGGGGGGGLHYALYGKFNFGSSAFSQAKFMFSGQENRPLFLQTSRQDCEADILPPSRAEVKKTLSSTFLARKSLSCGFISTW